MQRYLIKTECLNKPFIIMNKDDSYHMIKVMRMVKNDQVKCICDDYTYDCIIDSINDNIVTLKIINDYQEMTEMPIHLTIAHGLVNKVKMEEVVEKLSLLGCSKYLFFPMERSIVKSIDDKLDKKLDRLNKISKEASEVAHRTKIMESIYFNNFNEFIKYSKENYDVLLYAYEDENTDNGIFKRIVKNLPDGSNILVLVGPEGGISEKEVKLLNDNSFISCTIGPRILRTEVAPTYIASAISYEREIKE